MLNKNVADYTNFDGKTFKKIVQAPGGSSTISLSWSNEKTDYGPERPIKKKDNYPPYINQVPYQDSKGYQGQGNINYNEPIMVMDERPHYEMRNEPIDYPPRQQPYSSHSIQSSGSSQQNRKYGGEYGYNQYVPKEHYKQLESYNQKQPKQKLYQPMQSLELAVEEHAKNKNLNIHKPPQDSKRPSIKMHEQRSNVVIGDNKYNYWKDNNDDIKKSSYSNNRPPLYEQSSSLQKQVYQQKSSIKITNPPGGKSSFTFG